MTQAPSLCAPQVGPKGKVIGIDHIKELVDESITNVKKDDPSLITSGRVKLIGKISLIEGNRRLVFVGNDLQKFQLTLPLKTKCRVMLLRLCCPLFGGEPDLQ